MELFGRVAAVFAGGKDHESPAAREDNSGEAPLAGNQRIVGEAPVLEIERQGAGVLDLDPVGELAIDIGEFGDVVCHEFADDDVLGRQGAGGKAKGRCKMQQQGHRGRAHGVRVRVGKRGRPDGEQLVSETQ
jgi:hypothetical protein